jgi:hypothetical protein
MPWFAIAHFFISAPDQPRHHSAAIYDLELVTSVHLSAFEDIPAYSYLRACYFEQRHQCCGGIQAALCQEILILRGIRPQDVQRLGICV